MKLLRLLSTTEQESDYVAQFQEPVLLTPNSKIALQQISFSLNPEFISVTDENNEFYMLSSIDGLSSVESPYGYFKLTNNNYSLLDLTEHLRSRMNAGLIQPTQDPTFSSTNTTMEMTAYLNERSSLMNIEYAISALKQNEDLTFKGIANDDATPPNYYKAATYTSDWAGAFSTLPFSFGQGYAESFIYTNSGAYSIDGTCVGLLPLTPTITSGSPNMSPDVYKFCVFTQDGKYFYKQSGLTAVDSGFSAQDGDKIVLEQGRSAIGGDNDFGVKISRVRGTIKIQLAFFEYNFNLILHAGFSITGDAELKSFSYSPTSFATKTDSGVSLLDNIGDIEAHTYIRANGSGLGASATAQYLLRFTEGSQRLLGFPTIATIFKTGLTANWTGAVSMYNLAVPSSLVVEMPNLPLMSYDSYIHRRRPILAVIPSKDLELENDTITYTTSYPVFIDINNKYEELLNSIRIRLVAVNNKPLSIVPPYGCDISVLLD